MALARLELKTVKRSCGRSMPVVSAYRAGLRITDRRTDTVADYRRRTGVLMRALYGPAGEIDGSAREAVWNAAEIAERRRDSVVGREMVIALPHELSDSQRTDLARTFAARLALEEGVVADVAVHRPSQRGDDRNFHAHILFSSRQATVEGDGKVTFGAKTKVWDHKVTGGERLTEWRIRFEDFTNESLARAGSYARIDMRCLKAQGISRLPGRHNGPAATNAGRTLVFVRERIALAQEHLNGLALAYRLGADAGLIASLKVSLRTTLAALRVDDIASENRATAPNRSTLVER